MKEAAEALIAADPSKPWVASLIQVTDNECSHADVTMASPEDPCYCDAGALFKTQEHLSNALEASEGALRSIQAGMRTAYDHVEETTGMFSIVQEACNEVFSPVAEQVGICVCLQE